MARSSRPGRGLLYRFLAASGAGALLFGVVAATNAPHGNAEAHAAAVTRAAAVAAAPGIARGDGPPGFWYGTDSFHVSVPGSAPYSMPHIGGAYGGYIGMTGNWAKWLGCGDKLAWSGSNSSYANTNYTKYGMGIGTGVYWFMGGPGVDPHYNGTAAEAYAWGEQQAARTLFDNSVLPIKYPVVFMDVEIPGNAPGISPAPDNGWNSVYTSPCSGVVRSSYVPANVDRADFNGFYDYLTSHSSYKPGVYSSPGIWSSIFGTGSDAAIPHTYQWTYISDTNSLSRPPYGWCLSGTSVCAQFFGGVRSSSAQALMWQWSGGGGTYNGYGDFDQINATSIR